MDSHAISRLRRIALPLCVALSFLCLAAALASRADAEVSIQDFKTEVTSSQAGGHPDLFIKIQTATRIEPFVPPCFCNDPKDITISFPAGFIGNPHATPTCSALLFATNECPIDSQVGVVYGSVVLFDAFYAPFMGIVTNLEPGPGQAGLLGFKDTFIQIPIYNILSARTGSDFGLDVVTNGLTQELAFHSLEETLWGVPASPANDDLRFGKWWEGIYPLPPPNASSSPEIPYLQNPTSCSGPLTSHLHLDNYDDSTSDSDAPWPAITGCDQLGFKPSLSGVPSTSSADSASGLDVHIDVPQVLSPSTPSDSQLRAASVTLPKGFSINPNAGDGRTSCSDVDAHYGSEEEATCPEFSKVGTSSLNSTALPGPIEGAIYLGDPKPGDRYRLVLTADGYATHIKLPGTIHADPATGQIVASFDDLPQAPFSEFDLHFFGSERGALATPTKCGKYPVETTFVPWNKEQPNQNSTQFFTIDSGPNGTPCPGTTRPFNPGLVASTRNNDAGTHSPFGLELSRPDGDQTLSGLALKTPAGFAATLKGVAYCSGAALATVASPAETGSSELADPVCPASSQIGTAVAAVGAGSRPLHLPGKVYLSGPYRGAPLSLAVITPAVTGPYDLGNVVVRAALSVNPVTAQVTAKSDPLPQIIEGVPLRLRLVQVNLDRPGFTINPTNCDPFTINASVFGGEGGQAGPVRGFQAANCSVLPFGPKLSINLTGGIKRRGHPAIHAVLATSAGEANLRRVSVALPAGELLDNTHIGTVCTRPQFASDTCPAGSLLGSAQATTPLLDSPLKGSVYLRASSHDLPDLAIDLEGQIDIEVAGRIDTARGASLRATFENIPDAPITQFKLDLLGGKKGLLQNSRSLCGKAPKRATARMTGQNGAVLKSKPKLQVSCGINDRKKRGKG